MSVTDDFRAELDKHDVTWVNVTPLITGFVVGGKAYRTYEYDGMDDMDGLQLLSATPLTPQEVIAATLEDETCKADETDTIKCWVKCEDEPSTERMELIHVMECSVCGGTYEHVNGSYEFCPRCGRKVVDE